NALNATIFVITEPCHPLPCFEVVPEPAQATVETAGEFVVMSCNLVGPQSPFQSHIMHAGRERRSGRRSTYVSLWKLRIRSSRRGVIRHCEWIKRILNRHAYTVGAYSERMSCIREYVRRKRSRHKATVPEGAHVLEVGKKLQILIANFAFERRVKVFAVHGWHCWCEFCEVKEP